MVIHNTNGDGPIKSEGAPMGGPKGFPNSVKIEALKMVSQVGVPETSRRMNIHSMTIRNWVNIATNEFSCHHCENAYPWKSTLKKHIEQVHDNPKKANSHLKNKKLEQEVVQYALKTSRKDAKLQFNIPESTIRMWVKRLQARR